MSAVAIRFVVAYAPVEIRFEGNPMALKVVRAGTAIELWWTLTVLAPGQPAAPYAGAAVPTISIFDPTGAAQVTSAAMTNQQNGYWSCVYQTPANPSAAQLGVWTAEVTLIDTDGVVSGSADAALQQEQTPVFQLV
jgi:hypothetical protein